MKRVPNILSFLRILLAPVFVFLYLRDTFLWAALAMIVFIVAAITDYLDGYYARHYKASTHLGMFLDPLADKFLTFAGFICLPFIDTTQFPWWIISIIVFRDIFITMFRAWSEHKGHAIITRYSAKIKTMVQMVFLYIALLAGVIIKTGGLMGQFAQLLLDSGILGWMFVLVMIITVYTGLEYIYINRNLLSREPKTL